MNIAHLVRGNPYAITCLKIDGYNHFIPIKVLYFSLSYYTPYS